MNTQNRSTIPWPEPPTTSESEEAFWIWHAQFKRDHGRRPTRTEAWHGATLAAIAKATGSAS